MAYWLLKTEPSEYSFDDLARDRVTAWTGVANPQAVSNLRTMREGDRALIYHSGERRAVGVARVVRGAYPDPSSHDGESRVCVDVEAVGPLPAPVPLEALKQEPAFEGSALLSQGRLSVVPISPAQWAEVEELATVIANTGGLRRKKRF